MSLLEDAVSHRAAKALGYGDEVQSATHKIGGKHPDGTPIELGAWTFQTPQVRRVVEAYLSGRVLNACAGKTKLSHDGEIHRNDIDTRRDADTHFDVEELDEHLPEASFETVVFDPPFDSEQADEHYDGQTVGRGPSGGIWAAREALAELCAVGGIVLSIGWNSHGLQHLDGYERVSCHLFQRPPKPDYTLVVDRRVQRTLGGDGA